MQIISIQNTLKEPPKAVVSMKKTIVTAFLSTAAFYLSVAVTGYAALGSSVPGDVLTGFDVSPEVELIANAAVLLHMVAAVQVFQQPLYEVSLKCIVLSCTLFGNTSVSAAAVLVRGRVENPT